MPVGFGTDTPTDLDRCFAADLNARTVHEGATLEFATYEMGLSPAYVAWLGDRGLLA